MKERNRRRHLDSCSQCRVQVQHLWKNPIIFSQSSQGNASTNDIENATNNDIENATNNLDNQEDASISDIDFINHDTRPIW